MRVIGEVGMTVISLSDSETCMYGFIADDQGYTCFIARHDTQTLELDQKYPKARYRNYEHFAAVYCGFNPETLFLKEPIPIEELSYGEIARAKGLMP